MTSNHVPAPLRASARPVGRLADGTPYYVPIGQREYDPDADRYRCALCGRWMRNVLGTHIRSHGWTRAAYIEAFGLMLTHGMVAESVRRRLSEHGRDLLAHDPRVRDGLRLGADLVRAGANRERGLAQRGRPMPAERLAVVRPLIDAGRDQKLACFAERLAARYRELGADDIRAWLRQRYVVEGATLIEIAAQLRVSQPTVRQQLLAHGIPPDRGRTRRARLRTALTERLAALGFADLGSYVRDRWIEQEWDVKRIAAEAGVRDTTITSAIRRFNLHRPPTTKQHSHGQRMAEASHRASHDRAEARRAERLAGLGFTDLPAYLHDRYIGQHWTVPMIARELHMSLHRLLAEMDRAGIPRRPRHEAMHAARRQRTLRARTEFTTEIAEA